MPGPGAPFQVNALGARRTTCSEANTAGILTPSSTRSLSTLMGSSRPTTAWMRGSSTSTAPACSTLYTTRTNNFGGDSFDPLALKIWALRVVRSAIQSLPCHRKMI
ncbi:unnamed protein product [Musa acuminata subsp. burmannicoides]